MSKQARSTKGERSPNSAPKTQKIEETLRAGVSIVDLLFLPIGLNQRKVNSFISLREEVVLQPGSRQPSLLGSNLPQKYWEKGFYLPSAHTFYKKDGDVTQVNSVPKRIPHSACMLKQFDLIWLAI